MGIRTYGSLAIRWARILRGRSYYHLDQPVGKLFERHRVKGYYNDLTGKLDWRGEFDAAGVPVNALTTGERVYFPVGIAQMALGAYDCWLETGRAEAKEKFVTLASWLERHQDGDGGWSNHWRILRPWCVSDYSAMAQGEAISVLVRAHLLTGDETSLDAARRALQVLIRPVEEKGCSIHDGENLYLEEYPEHPRSTVLNGWIFAMFGLHDLFLVTNDDTAKKSLARTLQTLERSLGSYDCGYWSFYDVRGEIASPFYHRLHTALFDALFALTGIGAFAEYSALWKGYGRKMLNRNRALVVKVWQKLKNPGEVMIAR